MLEFFIYQTKVLKGYSYSSLDDQHLNRDCGRPDCYNKPWHLCGLLWRQPRAQSWWASMMGRGEELLSHMVTQRPRLLTLMFPPSPACGFPVCYRNSKEKTARARFLWLKLKVAYSILNIIPLSELGHRPYLTSWNLGKVI